MLEPFERVKIEVDLDLCADIIENMNNRKGVMIDAFELADGNQQIEFKVPSRGLLGFRSWLTQKSKGTAQFQSQLDGYDAHVGDIKKLTKGAIINTAKGKTTGYALKDIEQKGELFVGIGEPSYEGHVIGEHVLDTDMEMNAVKTKALTNFRVAGKEEQIKLSPHKKMSLEEAVSYIRDDELVEVTPLHIRIRKQILEKSVRDRAKRDAKNKKKNS